jgi:hypothetical protein
MTSFTINPTWSVSQAASEQNKGGVSDEPAAASGVV